MAHGFMWNPLRQAGLNFATIRSIVHRTHSSNQQEWRAYHRIRFHLQPLNLSKPIIATTSDEMILIWLLPSSQDASSFPHLDFRVMLLHGGQDEMGAKLRFASLTYLTFPSTFLFIVGSSLCLWSLSGIPRCLSKGLCLCSMAPYDTERCDRQWMPLHRWRATKLTWKEEDRINTLIGRASALYLTQQGLTWSNVLKIIKQRRMEDRLYSALKVMKRVYNFLRNIFLTPKLH
jgi:hypothetical protein